jgi:hypothetical protein
VLNLEPGGEAVYAPPGSRLLEVGPHPSVFQCDAQSDNPDLESLAVTCTLTGEDGQSFSLKAVLGPRSHAFFPADRQSQAPPFRRIKSLKLTTDAAQPVRLLIDHIALGRDEASRPR